MSSSLIERPYGPYDRLQHVTSSHRTQIQDSIAECPERTRCIAEILARLKTKPRGMEVDEVKWINRKYVGMKC